MKDFPLWHYRRWLPTEHPLPEDRLVVYGILFYLSVFWLGMLWPGLAPERILVALLVSLVFTGLVFRGYWHADWGVYVYMSAVASLCYLTLPFSQASIIFLFSPGFELKHGRLWLSLLVQTLLAFGVALQAWWMDALLFDGLFLAIILLLVLIRCAGDFFWTRYMDQQKALLKSQDEAEHLARTAERERIARDLHDLLGHTLSGIRIKAELANRLMADRPEQAANEVREIEKLARDSLQQVRATVSGYHEGGIALEINAARSLLSSAGIHFRPVTTDAVPARLESTLAAVLREGVTNIVRHAHATEVDLSLVRDRSAMTLRLDDNGQGRRGGSPGNGMHGIQARARAVGGLATWQDLKPGTRLQMVLPLQEGDYE
ncbi:MAG: sensor histidine kinase [Natronospirillum sp.]|uniref:sensor histidine kinase n=1 Tax=Natronospirillum sp. TaxID=2812955 RepID=UPI0025DC10E7|nr:sensor histidine kinase [Natronospirillum sp.]MCH8550720.1 sensor histidine kinase [Natronospirillum sp.]